MINLDSSKTTMYGDIPIAIEKPSINIHLDFLIDIINKSFRDGEFQNILKYTYTSQSTKRIRLGSQQCYNFHRSGFFEAIIFIPLMGTSER